jgi:transmembrane sensor
MNQKKFNKILKKYLSGTATEEERQIVDAWYEDMGKKSSEVNDDSKEHELEKYYWTSISRNVGESVHIVKNKKTKRTKHRLIRYSIGIAASVGILMIVGVYFLLVTDTAHNALARNEKKWGRSSLEKTINTKSMAKQFVLPDGSKITLDPNSKIVVSSDFNTSFRDINLVGKAFFEVAHNPKKPFRVYANGVITKVLGTSFTIKAYKNDKNVIVAVRSGRVSIYRDKANAKPETILTPNHQITYDKEKKTLTRGIVVDPRPLIKEEEIKSLRFEAAPVKDIFLAMEKVYGVDIVFDEAVFSSCKLTTSLVNGGLYDRLNIVTTAIGATYSLDENVIIISGAGCN